jgi:signal peptidase II
MTTSDRHRAFWPTCCFLLAGLAGAGCDLQTKAWAEESLGGVEGGSVPVVEPWLELTLRYNRGTAFSAIGDLGSTRTVLGALSLATAAGLLLAVLLGRAPRAEALALGAIAAGALGNGLDRLFREAPGGGTGVVDFVKVNFPWGGSWPAFNVADALLVIGPAAFLLLRWHRARLAAPLPPTAG